MKSRTFGYQLGRTWQLGQKGQDNGVVLIVAPNERKVRIEVGRGLEPQLTDAMSKLIVENAILPAFRRGDFTAGIKAGVRDVRDVLLGDAEAGEGARAIGGKARRRKRFFAGADHADLLHCAGVADDPGAGAPDRSSRARRQARSAL